ncbi:MAG: ABC transporter permease [Bacteroidales bacterium]|nr:ABC transporter permease [Bacteroidales bacterium]MBN2821263.1 ABC transporter permease [Bacteroidales bacterium]
MKLYKIAWRNLWRNRKRTAITSASILFAVFFAVVMRSLELGFYDHMIKNAIESYSGFLQIQHVDYQTDPSLENTIELDEGFIAQLENAEGVKAVVPRVQTFALASSGEQTKGALIVGIDPVKEKKLSNPEIRLVRHQFTKENIERLNENSGIPESVKEKLNGLLYKSYTNTGTIAMDLDLDEEAESFLLSILGQETAFPGEYLQANDDGVLVSERLSKYLKLKVGDTLILYGQGYQGATAADLFPVRGIVSIPNPELDNKLVYASLEKAQYFSNLGNRISNLAINLDDNSDKNLKYMEKKLSDMLNSETVTVENWKVFNKVLWQQIESDNNSGIIFLGLLYFIIFFGIFGTVLMMIHERYREFGVMVSIGMQKTRLSVIMIYEMILMGILGVLSGIILSLPLILTMHYNPVHLTGDMAQMMEDMGFEAVMPLASPGMYMVWQAVIVAIMVALSSIYPIRKIFALKEIDALRA